MSEKHSEGEAADREHGEGNYKAAREYQRAVKETAGSKQSERAAREAKSALEDPKAREELLEAEREAKRHAADDTP